MTGTDNRMTGSDPLSGEPDSAQAAPADPMVAAGSDRPVVAFMGDLALLHDLGALYSAERLGLHLTIVCVDNDADKIERLRRFEIPIYEPGLDEYVERNVEAGRLEFTTDTQKGVDHGLFQFIAVGTPPDEDGSADLKHVLAVAKSIGQHMNDYRIVVDKSTVPVGTADKVRAAIRGELNARDVALARRARRVPLRSGRTGPSRCGRPRPSR